MSDSDRQLLFADYVIELQAAEDDKRRRIRDARRRAEKAQREAYRNLLKRMAVEGIIRPHTGWKSSEEFVAADSAFNPVLAQDREAPREIFEEFVDEWDDLYQRERVFLSRLLNPPDKKEVLIKPETTLDDFTKLLLEGAESSPEMLSDTRRIINREEPVSTARLYLEELVSIANNSSQRQGSKRRVLQDESSEDEGEIIEEGETTDAGGEQEAPMDTLDSTGGPEDNSITQAEGIKAARVQDLTTHVQGDEALAANQSV